MIGVLAPGAEDEAGGEMSADREDQIPPGGPVVHRITPERLLVIAEALAKSVVLARDEREVATVFDIVEPYARESAKSGRMRGGRRAMLKRIGKALLVRYRVWATSRSPTSPTCCGTGPIWNGCMPGSKTNTNSRSAPTRSTASSTVIAETAQVLTDIIDTQRSSFMEMAISCSFSRKSPYPCSKLFLRAGVEGGGEKGVTFLPWRRPRRARTGLGIDRAAISFHTGALSRGRSDGPAGVSGASPPAGNAKKPHRKPPRDRTLFSALKEKLARGCSTRGKCI